MDLKLGMNGYLNWKLVTLYKNDNTPRKRAMCISKLIYRRCMCKKNKLKLVYLP